LDSSSGPSATAKRGCFLSGYAAANYKLFVFVLAALIASMAGALYVPQVGIINPSELATDKSLEGRGLVRRRRTRDAASARSSAQSASTL